MTTLTGCFNVLVHIITSCWGVWDIVMGHKVNLQHTLQWNQIYKSGQNRNRNQIQKHGCHRRSELRLFSLNSRGALWGTQVLASREHLSQLHQRSGSVWRHHSARPHSSQWSPCICGSCHHCTLQRTHSVTNASFWVPAIPVEPGINIHQTALIVFYFPDHDRLPHAHLRQSGVYLGKGT